MKTTLRRVKRYQSFDYLSGNLTSTLQLSKQDVSSSALETEIPPFKQQMMLIQVQKVKE